MVGIPFCFRLSWLTPIENVVKRQTAALVAFGEPSNDDNKHSAVYLPFTGNIRNLKKNLSVAA